MVYFGGLLGILMFGLWLFCLVDVITTGEGDTRNLPRIAWLAIVLFFPLVGSSAWLIAGKPARPAGRARTAGRTAPTSPGDRPDRSAATDPESEAEFLRRFRERAESQRRKDRTADDETP